MKIREIIVVEGKDDTAKLKQSLDVDTIETNGSAITKQILDQIAHAKQKRGVIVFTDPDHPGHRIRKIIDERVPGCKHAFLTKEEAVARNGKGLGIEHASSAVIRQALSDVYELTDNEEPEITRADLFKYGLIGGKGSQERRKKLGVSLRIGYVNAKQLLHRLQMFQISQAEFEKTMERILQEEDE